jgi:hypothetical protein
MPRPTASLNSHHHYRKGHRRCVDWYRKYWDGTQQNESMIDSKTDA